MACFVCTVEIAATHDHHVVPQAAGGAYGPEVELCPTCHNMVHNAAHLLSRGKSADVQLAHLNDEARARASFLAQAIVVAEINRKDGENPNPLLSVKFDSPLYMKALDMLKAERGFTSRDSLINAMFREVARGYGLLSESDDLRSGTKTVKFSCFNTKKGGLDRRSKRD